MGGGGRGGGEALSGELGELGDSGLGDQGVMVSEAEREIQPRMVSHEKNTDNKTASI